LIDEEKRKLGYSGIAPGNANPNSVIACPKRLRAQVRFVDKFDVVLLDMGRTFMFDVDRFSSGEHFGTTYRDVGGKTLSDGEVSRAISALFEKLLSYSRNPVYYDEFPSVLYCLQDLAEAEGLPERELKLLERVFALHEIGTVPDTHAAALRRLRATHRLGVVSDGPRAISISGSSREREFAICLRSLFFLRTGVTLSLRHIPLRKR